MQRSGTTITITLLLGILLGVLLATLIILLYGCADNTPKPSAPIIEQRQAPSEVYTERRIAYSELATLSTVANSGVGEIPVVQLGDYPGQPLDYNSLDSKARKIQPNSECRGDLECWTRCMPVKEIIIVTGIPNGCSCYRTDDGLAIICHNGCPSYIISCGGGVHN